MLSSSRNLNLLSFQRLKGSFWWKYSLIWLRSMMNLFKPLKKCLIKIKLSFARYTSM